MEPFDSIALDKNGGPPLYRQLADALRRLIDEGALKPETKLPSIRALAKMLSVNGSTAVSAYKYLENRKYIYSAVGSGTYVSPLPAALPAPLLKNQYSALQTYAGKLSNAINFADTSTDAALFPVDAFKRAFDTVLERDRGAAFDYQDSQGYEPLRESLSVYLNGQGIRVPPECIQIISGAQQGLDILAKALLSQGDAALTEAPTFYGAVGAFASRGAELAAFPLFADGPDMTKLESLLKLYKPKCLYIMPNFQTPTGISYSMEKKRAVLELAYKYDTWIIEEDNQNDFYYDGRRRAPLKALDYRGKVAYIKSFSKILMPGLRLGFAALPRKLALASVKRHTDIATSGFIQRAFDAYMRGGGLKTHGALMRGVYGGRYNKTLAAMDAYLARTCEYAPPGGGLSFWVRPRKLPENIPDTETLCGLLLSRGVICTPGGVFAPASGVSPYFRISFAAAPETRLAEGIGIIASALESF